MTTLRPDQIDLLARVGSGEFTFDQTARFHYLSHGEPVDFWLAASIDELLLAGLVQRNVPAIEVTQTGREAQR